jgi:hypothetical protein
MVEEATGNQRTVSRPLSAVAGNRRASMRRWKAGGYGEGTSGPEHLPRFNGRAKAWAKKGSCLFPYDGRHYRLLMGGT